MSLIGKTVTFYDNAGYPQSGKIVEKIFTNAGEKYMPGTGYLIELEKIDELQTVPYFRIISIKKSREISKVGPEDRVNLNNKLPGIIPKQSSPKTAKNPE